VSIEVKSPAIANSNESTEALLDNTYPANTSSFVVSTPLINETISANLYPRQMLIR
jgi:hypothetical protein